MLLRLIRFLAGVALLPACVAVTLALVSVVRGIPTSSTAIVPPAMWALGGGFLFWLVLYLVLPAPVRTYVLAHELTHALWGSLMGARVSGLNVSDAHGSVTLSKTNFLITLAPYFFPLYTVLTVAGYYLLSVFVDVGRFHLLWLGLVGFTWGFHVTFTISALAQHQSDIQSCGRLFSYTVIYAFNVIGVALWVVMVSAATLEDWVGRTWVETRIVYVAVWERGHDWIGRSGTIKAAVERHLR